VLAMNLDPNFLLLIGLHLSGRLSGASSQNRKASYYRRFAAFERRRDGK
jgi:hypothetical protein